MSNHEADAAEIPSILAQYGEPVCMVPFNDGDGPFTSLRDITGIHWLGLVEHLQSANHQNQLRTALPVPWACLRMGEGFKHPQTSHLSSLT